MTAWVDDLVPALWLFGFSVGLTAWALWIGARLAPWFLKQTCEPPSLRSFFLEPLADTDMTPVRLVTGGVATAIVLFVLLSFVIAARFQLWVAGI
ncbi:MAG: hypothetical protein GC155_12505 [Alphaproteobacteria bacterium]|nr:hypothetical protein [Alphaproteobacteria bacterium]